MKNMLMKDFLNNPLGKFSTAGARRSDIIFNLEYRFKMILGVVGNKINYKVLKDNESNYYFYFKIPSEKYLGFFYDVVIKFFKNESSRNNLLSTYSVNVFSNSPNFLFTYAYVYNNENIIIDFLKTKVSSKALNEPPKIKNPKEEFGFEKSIYFAFLYIKWNELFKVNNIKEILNFQSSREIFQFFKSIPNTELKLNQYNIFKKKKIEENKKYKKKRNFNTSRKKTF